MEFKLPLPTTMSVQELVICFYGCLENSDDGFLFVDPNGNIAYINDTYCRYISVSRADVLGKPVLDYIDTSYLVEAATNQKFKTQIGILHRVSEHQYKDGEHYCTVNRSNISSNGTSLCGAGQIKFVSNTLKLSSAIKNVYEELSYYKNELLRLSADRYSFQKILGSSDKIDLTKKLAARAAQNDFPVLITGETGTGKEVFSSAIHYASHRKSYPFVRINCAAIPAELLESELFGYMEGAFTGARKGGKKGKFELADGGTLFLDEIGDMPLAMQAKLLRVLQENEIERVGGEKPVNIDVRIIAATNKDLVKEISKKRFRMDLFYRLNVISLNLPPLRERPEDIDIFVDTFLSDLNKAYRSNVHITGDAKRYLRQYSWPGNVRELKNIIERCYVIQESGVISHATVLPNLYNSSNLLLKTVSPDYSLESIMNSVEREIIMSTIQKNQGNMRKSAAELGIHRVTLYNKLEKHGLHRSDFEPE